ncbi:stage II sporulation protein R [Jeotgalibacillus salarius]|nr:stage II sporulation protein R [Jeotgalibacillus salarius]
MIKKTMILAILLTILTPVSAFGEENDIRMRVIAHSDTAEDQLKKQQLYQSLQTAMIQMFGDKPLTREQLSAQLTSELPDIKRFVGKEAKRIAPEQVISTAFEPHTFPDGKTYLTLVITMGDGAGQNWWCTFFPEICGTVTLDEENGECTNNLSPEKKVSKTEIKVESLFVNWISETWNRFNEKRG